MDRARQEIGDGSDDFLGQLLFRWARFSYSGFNGTVPIVGNVAAHTTKTSMMVRETCFSRSDLRKSSEMITEVSKIFND